MDLHSLLTEIELDVKELKLLINSSSSATDDSAKSLLLRNINQAREHLDSLYTLLATECNVQSPDTNECPELPTPEREVAETVDEELEAPVEAEPMVVVPSDVVEVEPVVEHHLPESEPEAEGANEPGSIIADMVPKGELRSALSLNDSFLYARELFGGSMESLNNFLDRASMVGTFDDASRLFAASIDDDTDEEVREEMLSLLKRYFE